VHPSSEGRDAGRSVEKSCHPPLKALDSAGSQRRRQKIPTSFGDVLSVLLRARLEGADADAYDSFVAAASDGSFAQLRDYAALATSDRPFSASYFLAREGNKVVGTALVLRSRLGPLPLPFAQVERGPVVDDVSRFPEVLRALRRALRLRGIARLVVMPYFAGDLAARAEAMLRDQRFRPDDDPNGSHVRTLRMPIDAPKEADVYEGSGRKTLRYELKQAKKLGVVTTRVRGRDSRALVELLNETMTAQGMRGKDPRFAEALDEVTRVSERIACFVSRDAERDLGAILVARTDTRLHLVLGATSNEKRPFSKMSPPLEAAIAWARTYGTRELDLGGIPREGDTDEKRLRIAAFKYGFSKDEVSLAREHVRWV